eukprot:TRINITY_DN8853_c0_g1_i1.p1 TRINITY_DN8853_c0_g1~~TRINITY_DN8853_c0_g1_i1.p1  ORF type:complete len:278 (+),score=57.43 TRINITY_DN8853_c0_g1_i1:424-1257(+)
MSYDRLMPLLNGDVSRLISRIQKDETLLHKNICGINVLHGAAYFGRGDIVKALLEMGADVQITDSIGRTPIHYSAMSNKEASAIRSLHEHGADINATDKYGMTPLHVAYQRRQHRALQELLILGADVNKGKDTVLHWAAKDGDESLVSLFLNHGSKVNARNECGETPLYLACRKGFVNVCRLLMMNGAKMDIKTNENQSCMTAAVQGRHYDVVTFLEKNQTLVARVCHDIGGAVVNGSLSLDSLKRSLPLELWEMCCDCCRIELLKLEKCNKSDATH